MISAETDSDPKFAIRTQKAAEIGEVIHLSLLEAAAARGIKLRFLIFGPGKHSDDYTAYRLPLKVMIEDCIQQIADFPEDIEAPLSSTDELSVNPAMREFLMIPSYDFLIILLMNEGAVAEYSLFFTKEETAQKMRIYIPKHRMDSGSFLITGPVKMFIDRFGHVYFFGEREDLLQQARNMILNHLMYKIISH